MKRQHNKSKMTLRAKKYIITNRLTKKKTKDMNELYWITVFGKLSTVSLVATVIIGFVFLIIAICCLIAYVSTDNLTEKEKNTIDNCLKLNNRLLCVGLFSLALTILVPTKNELYAIYGIGTVIDYVQNNDTLKQIPNKAIEAIDAYLEGKLKK